MHVPNILLRLIIFDFYQSFQYDLPAAVDMVQKNWNKMQKTCYFAPVYVNKI